jgi:hypothetical protein
MDIMELEMTLTFIFNNGAVTKVEVETRHAILEQSADARRNHLDDVHRREVDPDELQAQTRSLDTMDAGTYRENGKERFIKPTSPGAKSLDANRAHRGFRRRRFARKQSFRANMCNELLAFADQLQMQQDRAKVGDRVPGMFGVFGRPMFASRGSCNRSDIVYMAKLMPVFLVEEDYTSQVSIDPWMVGLRSRGAERGCRAER